MYHRVRTIILVAALAIIIFVPILLDMVVAESQRRLNTRAEGTPLILGEKGSSLDLAINSLYFIAKRPGDITMANIQTVDETELGYSIPLYTRFASGQRRIVGTTPDYVDFRQLHLAKGRMFTILGEAVIGAKVAGDLKLAVGDTLISSPENLFDLAGQYPLQMNIVGILAPTGTADTCYPHLTWDVNGLVNAPEELRFTLFVSEGAPGTAVLSLTRALRSSLICMATAMDSANSSLIQACEIPYSRIRSSASSKLT